MYKYMYILYQCTALVTTDTAGTDAMCERQTIRKPCSYLFISPVLGVLPHDPGNARLFAAEGYDTADVVRCRDVVSLVEVAGNAELPGGGLYDFVAIVMVDIRIDMPGSHFYHQPAGLEVG